MALYDIQQLSFTYSGAARPALEELTLAILPGEFVVLCGPSGGGKTTLLRQLKSALAPHGWRRGSVSFHDAPLGNWDALAQAARIGFLQQSPDNQIVSQKVWQELAFGLENLALDGESIRLRVAEAAAFLGIEGWFYQDVATLSGGQKQLLSLAAVLAMEPEVLILDEPTAQLDPIAAAQFLSAIARASRELGVTVILSEHRLEEALPYADRLLLLEAGRLLFDGSPREAGEALRAHQLFAAMPTPMRVWAGVESDLPCPLSIGEGRAWLNEMAALRPLPEPLPQAEEDGAAMTPAIQLDDLYFRYGREGPPLIQGASFHVPKGKLTALLGGNGAGKTTLLSLIAGIETPQAGHITAEGRVALLPQNPQTLFVRKTLRLDLLEVLEGREDAAWREERVTQAAALCQVEGLLERHPFDLSGGEQQRAALAKLLLTEPDILLLDEPTQGMDAAFKLAFAAILKQLLTRGITALLVSHDVEFCASHADFCALLFDGAVISQGPPSRFFAGKSYYTTAASRMARHLLPEAVTPEDIIDALKSSAPDEPPENEEPTDDEPPDDESTDGEPPDEESTDDESADGAPPDDVPPEEGPPLDPLPEASAPSLEAATAQAEPPAMPLDAVSPDRKRLPRRTQLSVLLSLLLIPLTILLGTTLLKGDGNYAISMLVILEAMLPFFLLFEGRRPQARVLVVLAVLCALGVVGRAAFFWLPQCKPVVALVVVVGIALGGEAGFLVGAMTGFLSGFFFGQGPWTPWQMFAFGLIGLLAALLFQRGPLPRGRISVALFGGLAACFLYGFLMDASTALLAYGAPTLAQLIATCALGFPFNLTHGIATVVFLLLGGPLLGDALARVKQKYGLLA